MANIVFARDANNVRTIKMEPGSVRRLIRARNIAQGLMILGQRFITLERFTGPELHMNAAKRSLCGLND